DEALAQSGERPIARLQRLGILTPNTQCIHMTAVNDDDIALLAASGAQVVHCPKSNLKLASGFCPEHRLREAGINVALGTDGAASNNSLDLFSEMAFASLLSKGLSGNAAALDTHASLRMATLNGARALGMRSASLPANGLRGNAAAPAPPASLRPAAPTGARALASAAIAGSREVGKGAALVAVDLGGISREPMYNPLSPLVHTPVGHRVSDVWVNGAAKVRHGQLQSFSEQELETKARQWRDRILG